MLEVIEAALKEAQESLKNLSSQTQTLAAIAKSATILVASFQNQGHVYSCGNGGSMCDAMHFAEEMSGRFRKNRPALAATAINCPAHMSCTANDFGYNQVFSRYIEGFGRKGDVLLAISTSGQSPNVIEAAKVAKSKEMKVISLTGNHQSALANLADVDICTPSPGLWADRVQELHIKCIHILIELCEKELFPHLK